MAKKLWEILQEQAQLNETSRQEAVKQANEQFNTNISKKGTYNISSTTTIGNLRKAYKDTDNYNTVRTSLNNYYENNKAPLWDRVKAVANNMGRNAIVNGVNKLAENKIGTSIFGNQNNSNKSREVTNSLTAEEKKEHFNSYSNSKKNYMDTISNVIKQNSKIKEQNQKAQEEQIKNSKISSVATVTKDQAEKKQKAVEEQTKLTNSQLKIAKDLKDVKTIKSGDMFKLTNGQVDDRTQIQKVSDDIAGVAGNVAMGAESVIPSAIKYENALGEMATKKAVQNISEQVLKKAGINDTEIISNLAEQITDKISKNIWGLTPIAEDNNKINSEEMENWRKETIQANINKTSNTLTNKLAEITPSVGQNLLPMGVSAVSPVAGTALFITSAAGNYLNEAEELGMSEEQSLAYATVMGGIEGATEAIISTEFINSAIKKVGIKGFSNEILHSTGVNIGENFIQEWATEYIDEYTKSLVSYDGDTEDMWKALSGQGKYADWEDIHERALQAGIDGIISAVILDGASLGVASAVDVVKGKSDNISKAYNEAKKVVDMDKIKEGAGLAVQKEIKQEVSLNNQGQNTNEINNDVANNLQTLYNNTTLGETTNVPIQDILSIQKQEGYRTSEEYETLKQDIMRNGIKNPIELARNRDGSIEIENGNHRLQIAKELGLRNIPVKFVESWDNIGINSSNNDIMNRMERYNDNSKNGGINNSNGTNELQQERRINNSNEFRNRQSMSTNDKLYNGVQEYNNRTSSGTTFEKNNQELEQSSSNILPSKEQNINEEQVNSPTKGETINWNEMERPEGKIRKHYRSIIKSGNTTALAKTIARELMGTDTYIPDSNKKQLERANTRIENSTPSSELNSLMSRVQTGERITSTDIAVGERLIQYYSLIGDKAKLQDAIQVTAMAGTTAGQTVQAMRLLNHQTPEGQAIWVQRSVDKMNTELKNKRGDNAPQFDLTQDMVDKIVSSENQEQLYNNLNEVYDELGQQVSKSFWQQIDAWRYFCMLGNPKTHIRNMVGNILMGTVQDTKNKVAGGIEGVASKFYTDMDRTHTIKPSSKEVLEFAENDIKNVVAELGLNDNKYNPKSRLENSMRTFKSDAMENSLGRLFKWNDNLLEAEDGLGLKAGYKKALAEYMTANKLTPDNITDTQLSKARNYAIQQAEERTFHQANAIASALNSFFRKNKATKAIGDAILPFVKTPANVAKTGIEYSPAGLAKSIVYDTVQLRKGNININQYIDNISKGLTGSAITVLGFALAQSGILKASGGDDDKKKKFDEQSGKQAYSIQVGDKTYSIDWLAPVGIPLMVGAEIYEGLTQKQNEKNTKSTNDEEVLNKFLEKAEVLSNSLSSTLNPMVEMSMISSLTSTLKSYAQGDAEALGSMLTNAGKSYINQFVPTLVGQIAKTTDTVDRDTTSTKSGVLEKAVDSTINQIKSKIPGLRQTLPTKKDIWGNDIELEDNWAKRFFYAGILPTNVKTINNDTVVKELNNLYDEIGESSVLPTTITKTFTINGTTYRMTNEEYNKYKKDYGQTSYELISNLVESSDYANMTAAQKQKAIEEIYSYAKEKNKVDYANKVNENVEHTTTYSTLKELKKQGGSQSQYLSYIGKTQSIDKDAEKNEVLLNSNYTLKTKAIIYQNTTGKQDELFNVILKRSDINIDEYLSYKIKNSNNEFSSDKDENGNSISGTAKNKIYNYVNNNISGVGNRLLILGSQYKLQSNEIKVLDEFIQKNYSTDEALEVYKKLSKNFTVKDGKAYYK